jgi:predicted nucleotidyltransferase
VTALRQEFEVGSDRLDCRMSIEAVRQHRQQILELAARHGARDLSVFGSVAGGDARPDSDIDLLVDMEPGRTLLDVIAFEQDLLLARRAGRHARREGR